MNETRTADLEEMEGCRGFIAFTHPSVFMGVPKYPRLWDEGSRLHWGPHLVGTLSVPTPGRSRSLQCLGKPYQPEVKQGFHRQRKINTRIPHLYLQRGVAFSLFK